MNPMLNDPEFLKWEAGLVGDPIPAHLAERRSQYWSEKYGESLEWFKYHPGPSARHGYMTQVVQPLMLLKDDSLMMREGVVTSEAMVVEFKDEQS